MRRNRRPEVQAEQAPKGDGPGRASFEGRPELGHLGITGASLHAAQ